MADSIRGRGIVKDLSTKKFGGFNTSEPRLAAPLSIEDSLDKSYLRLGDRLLIGSLVAGYA
jgi:hypothetical protein